MVLNSASTLSIRCIPAKGKNWCSRGEIVILDTLQQLYDRAWLIETNPGCEHADKRPQDAVGLVNGHIASGAGVVKTRHRRARESAEHQRPCRPDHCSLRDFVLGAKGRVRRDPRRGL